MSQGNSLKAVIFALVGNLLIASIKFIVSFITGSAAMLAEGIHSAADSLNQVFLLIGNKRSQRAANEEYSFGFSREIFFWSLMVAVLLFFVGGIFSVYEGISKLAHPHELTNVKWIFIVLIVSIIIETKSYSVALTEFRKTHKGSLLKAVREATDVSLVVILLEDLAALLGLTFVLISTVLAWFIHPVFDAIGSLFVGLLLVVIAIVLITEVKKLVIGESMPRQLRSQVKQIVKGYRIVRQINNLKTMVTGNNRYLVVLSVDIDNDETGYNIENAIDQLRIELKRKVSGVDEVYIDIKDPNRSLS